MRETPAKPEEARAARFDPDGAGAAADNDHLDSLAVPWPRVNVRRSAP
jgi:hypothetical protein